MIASHNRSNFLHLANHAFRQGAFDEAIKLYLQAAEAFPELAHVYAFNVGLTRKYAQRWCAASGIQDKTRRAVVFATYSSACRIESYVLYYLRHLRPIAGHIVVVGDFAIDTAERMKLNGLADHTIFERHGEYDFGSYKRGYAYLAAQGFLDQLDELILCNDSCYGPVQGFCWMFREMASRQVDFWGVTQNSEFADHIQSYFVVLTRKVFCSPVFQQFICSVEPQESVDAVIQKYEIGLTRTLVNEGFSWDTLINSRSPGIQPLLAIHANPTVFPNFLVKAGAQFVKVKATKYASCNADPIHVTLGLIGQENLDLLRCICMHQPAPSWRRWDIPFFSVILATFNRAYCVAQAIDSILDQSYENYELIVVDDSSTDHTSDMICERFQTAMEQRRLRLLHCPHNVGAAMARNIGLAAAQGDWIAYLDSDNIVERDFLQVFAHDIQQHPELDCCYAMMRKVMAQEDFGFPFDYQKLLLGNYIDLGVFVHRRSLLEESGYFDVTLRRLIDWDLLIRMLRNRRVRYIPRVVMHYRDDLAAHDRISVRECHDEAFQRICQKYGLPPLS